jgi:hypothetical protein
MAVAKQPGIGQGRGGGRPKGKTRDVEEIRLRLSPHVAQLLRSTAEAGGVPVWRVVESAILALQGGTNSPTLAPPLPPEAQEIASEVVAFLEAQVDRPAAIRVLRRAWRQAFALAFHELQGNKKIHT